jgi:hypothetical protein
MTTERKTKKPRIGMIQPNWNLMKPMAQTVPGGDKHKSLPRKVFDGTRGEDKAKTLNFPEMVESKSPPRASLFSRVVQKVFRKK